MHTVREHNRPCGTCMAVRSAWTVLGFAALGLAFCSFVSAAIATRVNRKMAGLTAPAVKASSVGGGAPVQTDSARGKVLLVNFFASWCPPCNKEMDNLQRLRASVSADKLMIVGIAMDPVVTP